MDKMIELDDEIKKPRAPVLEIRGNIILGKPSIRERENRESEEWDGHLEEMAVKGNYAQLSKARKRSERNHGGDWFEPK